MNRKNNLVDVIIVGAPKCGTTALFELLSHHSKICASKKKEPRFFTKIKGDLEINISGSGPPRSGNFNRGFNWYSSLFSHFKEGQLKLESSTVYFNNEDAVNLIKKYAPNAKIIIMLRDPVKRIYSHYWQEYKMGFNFPSFKEMVFQDHQRLIYYKKVSSYAINLSRFLKSFKKSNILILIQEEFKKTPLHSINKVCSFLNINQDLKNINFEKKFNIQNDIKSRSLQRAISRFQSITNKFILPKNIITVLSFFRKKISALNKKSSHVKKIDKKLYKIINKDFKNEADYIEKIIGKKPNWKY